MNFQVVEASVILIDVLFVIVFFILSVKKASSEEREHVITCYKAVMYVVVAIFTFAGTYGSGYEKTFLTASIITTSCIEAIDNGMKAKRTKLKVENKTLLS
ncbi:MAG: hypothetical protein KHZ72_14490 [Lachnospiraceae bacterium]|nr:hypothetical protein [Lachnospiraceae bacterium]